MWLSIGLAALFVFMVVGGALLGGIFTLVLVPVAVIAVVMTFLFSLWNRATESHSGGGHRGPRPVAHSEHRNTAEAPATPDALTDARRLQQ
jgi:hypothetical protein